VRPLVAGCMDGDLPPASSKALALDKEVRPRLSLTKRRLVDIIGL
jgi:hypothetical protein